MEIIVEYIPDLSKMESGIAQLTASGKLSKDVADSLKQVDKPLDQFARKTQATGKKVKTDVDGMSFAMKRMAVEMRKGFQEGVDKALKEAGISLDQFKKRLNDTTTAHKTLKQELRELTEQLARMKAEGKTNSDQYREMAARAGELKDAMADVSTEIKKLGSDTRTIDTVIESISGLAAVGQVTTGVMALAGSESEEFNKIMIRLNASMAIANGVQQIANLLQKESNIIRAITNAQLRAGVIATNLETAAQSKNIIVKGAATIAMRLLNAVMNANPVFLLISAFAAFAAALAYFSSTTKQATLDVELLNAELDRQKFALDELTTAIETRTRIRAAAAKNDAEKNKIEIEGMTEVQKAAKKYTDDRIAQLQKIEGVTFRGVRTASDAADALLTIERKVSAAGGFDKLDEASQKRITGVRTLINEIIAGFQKQDAAARQIDVQGAEFAAAQREKARQKAREADLAALNDKKAAIQRELLAAVEGSAKEAELKKKLIIAEANIELFNDKLTNNQKLLIQEQSLKARREINIEFYKKQREDAIKSAIDETQAELDQLNIGAGLREDLTIMLLNKQRELELSAVKNNAMATRAINAKFDKQIADARLAVRQTEFDQQTELIALRGAAHRRALEKELADEKTTVDRKIEIIQELANADLKVLERRRLALEENHRQGLISEREYQLELARIKDQEAVIHEQTEAKKTETTKKGDTDRIASATKTLDQIEQYSTQVLNSIGGILTALNAIEQQRIDIEKDRLDRLIEAGSLTEREAKERTKRLELEQRAAQTRAARREKTLNIFQAIVAGGAAIIKAAPNPFLIAFTAALVAAQIAAIIATPIPRFGKGTKSAPRGFAEVGETGTEIVQTDRGYYVADHPQIMWMKGGERVYNPSETEQIIRNPQADKSLMRYSAKRSGSGASIDYGRMAKTIGDEIAGHPRFNINLNERGFSIYTQQQLARTNYLNKRHTYRA